MLGLWPISLLDVEWLGRGGMTISGLGFGSVCIVWRLFMDLPKRQRGSRGLGQRPDQGRMHLFGYLAWEFAVYKERERDDDPGEERMNKHTKRRKRRRANSILRFGKSSVRAHRRQSGRTGQ